MKIMKTGILMAFFLLLAHSAVQAAVPNTATVLEIKGEAQFQKSGTADWVPLEKSTVLTEGDAVKTGVESEVILELQGDKKTAEITVRKNSEFVFKSFQHDPDSSIDKTLLDVELGSVLVKAEKLVGDSKFEVKTPTSIVGIRGTVFEVNVTNEE